MNDDAFSFYCKNSYGSMCKNSDLVVVKTLVEKFDDNGECTEREVIYKCAVCGGFYKRKYDATYYNGFEFDTDEGWSITDKYFKIEQPLWSGLGSSGKPPLTLDEARAYGYAGEDYTWKNGRCNFNVQNVEMTCRAIDLQFIAYRSPESKTHISDRFFKCLRCGEWYMFKLLEPYTEALLKPTNELFPVGEAKKFGYDAAQFIPKNEEKSLAVLFIENSEGLPTADEWLKENRSESEKADYAAFIVKKHFIRAGLKAVDYLDGSYGWLIFPRFLKLNLEEFVKNGKHAATLKDLLEELTDFYETATGESFAYYLFTRLESYVDGDAFYRRLEPLLPAENLESFEELRKKRERQYLEGIKKLHGTK